MESISIPKRLCERARELGIDLESRTIELLLRELNLNPREEAEVHVGLAKKLLDEGLRLMEEDPVQASEKLYKAAEECVKALAARLNLVEILEKVRERGRWTVTELEKAAKEVSDRVGEWFYDAWDHAWTLHVWGFHEARLDSDSVKRRAKHMERMVKTLKKA